MAAEFKFDEILANVDELTVDAIVEAIDFDKLVATAEHLDSRALQADLDEKLKLLEEIIATEQYRRQDAELRKKLKQASTADEIQSVAEAHKSKKIEPLDVDAIRKNLSEKMAGLEEAVKKEQKRRHCKDFCDRARAILANDSNGKHFDEVKDLILEMHTAFAKQRKE